MSRRGSFLRLLVVLLGSTVVLSCGGSDGGTGPESGDGGDAVARVTVSPSTQDVDVGSTVTYTAAVFDGRNEDVTAASNVTWSVSPSGIATVTQGGATTTVTGTAEGTATVRATAGGRTGQAAVNVNDPNPPATASGVTAVAVSHTAIEVGWSDNSTNEDLFRIEREAVTAGAGGGGGPARVFAEVGVAGRNETSFRDAGLDPGTSYRYLVRACNQHGCTPEAGSTAGSAASQEVVTHDPLAFETASLSEGVLDQAYEATLEASGGDGSSYTFALLEGPLPAGLALASDGVIGGTPTEVGTFPFEVEVQSGEQAVSADLVIVVSGEILAPEITTAELPAGIVGTPYEAQLEAIKGDGQTYAFAIVSGSPPDGVTMSAAGAFSGTPTAPESSAITVQVTSASLTSTRDLVLDVVGPLAIGTAELPDGIEGDSYTATLEATGGDGSTTWTLAAGALPDGLTLAPGGTISGTPAAAEGAAGGPVRAVGTFEFTVQAESGDGQTATADISITIRSPLQLTTADLPDGEVGVGYAATLTATGGETPYTWSADVLPEGVVLGTSTGELSGEPGAAGTTEVTITVTSADGQSDEATFSITVTGPPEILTTSLPGGTVGVAYDETLEATGGNGTYAWAVIAGSLGDLALDPATGVISGTPTTATTLSFTVEVTSDGETDTQALSIEVAAGGDPVSIDTDILPPGVVSGSLTTTVVASGGDGENYAWEVAGGSLPSGLSIGGSTGTISGTPTSAGSSTFTLRATSGGNEATKEFTIDVVPNDTGGFDLTILPVVDIPADLQTELDDAVERWEAIITGDLPMVTSPVGGLPAGFCDGFGPIVNGASIEDMVVIVNIASIDGDNGTIASAGPCGFLRSSPSTGFSAYMKLDVADLVVLDGSADGRQRYEDVLFHELGHVMGLGTRWDANDFVTGTGTTNPTYNGPLGVGEYNDLGEVGEPPLENDGGSGTAEGHWEESGSGAADVASGLARTAFDEEIMTGFIEPPGVDMPVSRMTIAAIEDLGFAVEYDGNFDPFTPTPAAVAEQTEEEEPKLWDTIYHHPMLFQRPDGTIVVVPPGGGE